MTKYKNLSITENNIISNDLEALKKSLQQNNSEINSSGYQSLSPLQFACLYSKNHEIIKELIEHKADIKIKDKNKNTILHISCNNNDVEVVKYVAQIFLDNDIDISQTNKDKLNPLHLASQKSSNEVVVALINIYSKSGLDVDQRTGGKINNTALSLYISRKDIATSVIEEFIRNGASVNTILDKGTSVFSEYCHKFKENSMITINKQYLQVIKCLIDNKAIINQKDDNGDTILHKLLDDNKEPNLELINYLLGNKALVNLVNTNEDTPLSEIISTFINYKFFNLDPVKLLIEYKANINDKIPMMKFGLLHSIVDLKDFPIEAAEFLINQKIDVNQQNSHEETPLMLACESKNKKLQEIKFLVEHGGDLSRSYKKTVDWNKSTQREVSVTPVDQLFWYIRDYKKQEFTDLIKFVFLQNHHTKAYIRPSNVENLNKENKELANCIFKELFYNVDKNTLKNNLNKFKIPENIKNDVIEQFSKCEFNEDKVELLSKDQEETQSRVVSQEDFINDLIYIIGDAEEYIN